MVPEYMYMNYFVRVLARTVHNFFLYVDIKRPLFLNVMNAHAGFVNPYVHVKYF